jgi:hypothetical protein
MAILRPASLAENSTVRRCQVLCYPKREKISQSPFYDQDVISTSIILKPLRFTGSAFLYAILPLNNLNKENKKNNERYLRFWRRG